MFFFTTLTQCCMQNILHSEILSTSGINIDEECGCKCQKGVFTDNNNYRDEIESEEVNPGSISDIFENMLENCIITTKPYTLILEDINRVISAKTCKRWNEVSERILEQEKCPGCFEIFLTGILMVLSIDYDLDNIIKKFLAISLTGVILERVEWEQGVYILYSNIWRLFLQEMRIQVSDTIRTKVEEQRLVITQHPFFRNVLFLLNDDMDTQHKFMKVIIDGLGSFYTLNTDSEEDVLENIYSLLEAGKNAQIRTSIIVEMLFTEESFQNIKNEIVKIQNSVDGKIIKSFRGIFIRMIVRWTSRLFKPLSSERHSYS